MSEAERTHVSKVRLLHTGAWLALAVALFVAAFDTQDSPSCLAAAVTAAYFAIGAWAGNVLYLVLFAPLVFFGTMFLSMFLILSAGR
jgi:hypothetical protein